MTPRAPETLLQTFRTGSVAGLFPVSLRQLQWWDERQLISPEHIGHARQYTVEQLFQIGIVADLRRKGISLQRLHELVRWLNKSLHQGSLKVDPEREAYLLLTGKRFTVRLTAASLIEAATNSREPLFMVDLRDIARRVVGHEEERRFA